MSSNSDSSSTDASTAAATAAATAAEWAAVKAEEARQDQLAVQKRMKEFEESIQREVALLPSNPQTGPPQFSRVSTWEGGTKRKRTTGTKKMKRSHARKSHRKSKRVMKR